ncbi:hypothetical protein N9M21_04490 [Alphaproteobacteria bacterium]|nr:hypothetical protein [Alphaproteobacteria bacterium]
MDDGVVVFQLEGGEELSLDPNQYLILEDGLLLITDEFAQASMQSLPVMGAIRAQLTSELQPVRSPDGSVVLAADDSPLWSGDGLAPRLFEEVDIQRFELAQNSSETQTQFEGNLGQAAGAAVGGLSLAGLSLLSSIPGTKSDEQATEEEEPSVPTAGPEFWTNADIPDNATITITGSSADSFVGYTAASTAAATSALTNLGRGTVEAIFDMSAGGNNRFVAGDNAGDDLGYVSYQGGAGMDSLTFGDKDITSGGVVYLDLGADAASDSVTFQGSIAPIVQNIATLTIKNFNYNHDTVDVPAGVSASAGEITSTNGDQDLRWTDNGGEHTITFEGIGSAGSGEVATAAQLIADII